MKKFIIVASVCLLFIGLSVSAQIINGYLRTDLWRGNPGNQTSDVTLLQQYLAVKGFFPAESIDGSFCPITQDAVIRFQQANSITPAEGYVGLKTRGVINDALENNNIEAPASNTPPPASTPASTA